MTENNNLLYQPIGKDGRTDVKHRAPLIISARKNFTVACSLTSHHLNLRDYIISITGTSTTQK